MSQAKRLAIIAASVFFTLTQSSSGQARNSSPSTPIRNCLVSQQKAGYKVHKRFTAQRRPRVSVLDFEDTNRNAEENGYGDSVEAMLVTFLRRKSQFIVVERKQLRGLEEERQLIGHGKVKLDPDESRARDLLEKLDATIYGNVTLLEGVQSGVSTASTGRDQSESGVGAPSKTPTPSGGSKTVQGPRIEIDAKLISRFDGRIIASAQRSGPVACLRSIVERLGIALEQEFLRPYYGKLRLELNKPGYVTIHLTPILLNTARDEEIPPAERSISVTIGDKKDVVQPWVTNPITYTVDNLLMGCYSMRLERPGFEPTGADNSRWIARELSNGMTSIERKAGTSPSEDRFIVDVPYLSTAVAKGFDDISMRRLGGSFSVKAMRQYLDSSFSQTPSRVMLVGGQELEINGIVRPLEYADDTECDLFEEKQSASPPYTLVHVLPGEKFDLSTFAGGELIIDDYKGEEVPAGKYDVIVWEPSYSPQRASYSVYDGDRDKTFEIQMSRETRPVRVDVSGPSPKSQGFLYGKQTRHRVDLSLASSSPTDLSGIPVDDYAATTDVPGLRGWREQVDLLAGLPPAPAYKVGSAQWKPEILGLEETPDEGDQSTQVKFKTRLVIGGHLGVLSRHPDPVAADLHIDTEISPLLDHLLSHRGERTEPRRSFWARIGFGRRAEAPKIEVKLATEAGTDVQTLRSRLSNRLQALDLLVLDARDMSGLESSPETAEIVAVWVAMGGTLFGFISEEGNYSRLVGAPLDIRSLGRRTRRFEMSLGEVDIHLPALERKVKVKSKRALPDASDLDSSSWQVLAYTKSHEDPRIIGRTWPESGGHVLLWLEDPRAFIGPFGGTVPKVEEVRKRVEEQAFDRARYGMYRRYDLEGENLRRAEAALSN